jgi:hypothetical protein
MVPEQLWEWHFCSYRCVFFIFCLFSVFPNLVLSVASWGSVNLAVFFFIVRMEISLFLWKIYVCGSLWSEFLGPRTGQHYLLLITYILFSSFLDIFLSSLLNLVGLSVIRMYIIPKSRPNLQKRFKTKSWWGMGCKLCNIHAYRANIILNPTNWCCDCSLQWNWAHWCQHAI